MDMKMWKKGTPKFKAGDVYYIRGMGFISTLIRFVISVRYGIPYRETFSHTELQYDKKTHVSAEPKGVMFVENDNSSILKASRVEVYRILGAPEKIKRTVKSAASFVGKGYAYARYLLDSWRLGMFFFTLAALFKIIFSSWNLWVLIGILAGFIAIEKILKYYDIRTMDCAEVVASAFDAGGIMPVLGKARDDHPSGIRKSTVTLEWNGKAELVAWRTNKTDGWMVRVKSTTNK